MLLGEEVRPLLEHRFRNAERIKLLVADCTTSGFWGADVLVTKNDLGRGILSKQLELQAGLYEVDYSVEEVSRALETKVQFPFRGRRYCSTDNGSISECFDSLSECKQETEEGLDSLMEYECRKAPEVAYCFEYSYAGSRYASCHSSTTACEGALGSNADAVTQCAEISVAPPR